MNIDKTIIDRSENSCELCKSSDSLDIYSVDSTLSLQSSVLTCSTCRDGLSKELDPNYWRMIQDLMWSEVAAIQALSWKVLKSLSAQPWASQAIGNIYLNDEAQEIVDNLNEAASNSTDPTKDSNGTALTEGDSVTLIKDLVVKGAGFTAKRGTLVKNIRLTNNPLHIEGRVNGTLIVLVTAYLKKV